MEEVKVRKLSLRDRCFGTLYSRKYRKDYETYLKNKPENSTEIYLPNLRMLSNPARKLGVKWGISHPFPPIKKGDPFQEHPWSILPSDTVDDRENQGDQDDQDEKIYSSFFGPVRPLPGPEGWLSVSGCRLNDESDENTVPQSFTDITEVNGDIVLTIDKRFTLEVILLEINKYLKGKVREGGSMKGTQVDTWYAYHRKILDELDEVRVAEEMGVDYQAVQNQLKRAGEIIRQVEDEALKQEIDL